MRIEVIERIAARLQTTEGKGYVKRFQDSLKQLHSRLTGGDGLFAAYRDYLKVKDEIASLQTAVAGIETRYMSSLEEVRELVEKRNEGAKARAAQMINQALVFIGAVVVAGLLVGLSVQSHFCRSDRPSDHTDNRDDDQACRR